MHMQDEGALSSRSDDSCLWTIAASVPLLPTATTSATDVALAIIRTGQYSYGQGGDEGIHSTEYSGTHNHIHLSKGPKAWQERDGPVRLLACLGLSHPSGV